MKVRVKLTGAATGVDVGDIDLCTLSELREKTENTFQLAGREFNLSLNKRDPLTGDQESLSTLGIVPGDLVFVVCPDLTSPASRNNNNNGGASFNANDSSGMPPNTESAALSSSSSNSSNGFQDSLSQPLSASSSIISDGDQGVFSVGGGMSYQQLNGQDSATSVLHPQNMEGSEPGAAGPMELPPSPCPLDDPEVNRCLGEPLLVRESSPLAVPPLLRDLHGHHACCTSPDALWLVVHALMVEVGFRPTSNQDGSLHLSEGWSGRGFYRQEYRHVSVGSDPSNAGHDQTCTFMGLPMGPTLVLHGVVGGDSPVKTDTQQLRVADYVYRVHQDVCKVYRNLERLSRIVKDLVCQPLLSALSDACGYPVGLGLQTLAYEIKLKILGFLPAQSLSRMGQVCQSFRTSCRDQYLWRRLYLREFGQHGDNSLSKDWNLLFRQEYLARKERRRALRERHQRMTNMPPWLNPPLGHFPPLAPSPYAGGVIGGDYDINPEFAPRIPHPLFGRPPGPNPFLPMGPGGIGGMRPRFSDPFGPDPSFNPHFLGGGGPNIRPFPGGGGPNNRPSRFGSMGGGHRFI